ncbi:MAG: DUF1326 domain-containing protein [Dehalococcoidia bacterium]|nr:DUF1326 domain-containing protein [Dehalococcoidia bacterium]
MTTAQRWRMRGEYFENCNCDVICPCLHSGLQATPTQQHCDVILAFNIQEGSYGTVSLSGLSFIMALQTPGPMGKGNGRLAIYMDEKADARQREALGAIVGGKAGGAPAVLPNLIPVKEVLGIKYVPSTFKVTGKRRSLEVPGIMDMNAEGLEGIPGQVMQLSNVGHPANTTLAVARGTKTTYKDYNFRWDNTGKNAHYALFRWSGP